MNSLKITSYFLGIFFIVSCQKRSIRQDITKKFPQQKIDTILYFDFDKNGIKDNIALLVSPKKENSIVLYMNNNFISINDKVLPKSIPGYEHYFNLQNRNNTLLIEDNFSTTRPKAYYALEFSYNKNLNKVILDSFMVDGRIEDNKEEPYFKNSVKKKLSKNQMLNIENGNFITKDSLDFKVF
ncbi:hypothetical protein [Chryseobacterium gambrini]|uniref:hypothetical protein n=1 Tax=Chryseobacterium gambrini TaxID=373672 RepID=UPI0022F406D2|nr:hypothetical protein [Chryseobacterium gambrini]WBX99461.1 hypothetical protein PE065_09450 [Chryseobacterium gambrini]